MSENHTPTIEDLNASYSQESPPNSVDHNPSKIDQLPQDRTPRLDPNEPFTLWDNEEELQDLLRRIVFKSTKRYWLSNVVLAEHFEDLYQTAWVKLLELNITHYDATKASILSRLKFTVSNYLEHQIFGWQPMGGSTSVDQRFRLIRFYQFMPEAYYGEYDDELLDPLLSSMTVAQVMQAPMNPEHYCCQDGNWHTVFDQWIPTLEDDLYVTIAASRLMNAPHHALRVNTIRRHAFMLTARLRGMRNVEIALATGRHSDRRKASMRVGADVAAARADIDRWLLLSESERENAITILSEKYPALSQAPVAYAHIDRTLLWGDVQAIPSDKV